MWATPSSWSPDKRTGRKLAFQPACLHLAWQVHLLSGRHSIPPLILEPALWGSNTDLRPVALRSLPGLKCHNETAESSSLMASAATRFSTDPNQSETATVDFLDHVSQSTKYPFNIPIPSVLSLQNLPRIVQIIKYNKLP